jgi:hypothetical protein
MGLREAKKRKWTVALLARHATVFEALRQERSAS